MINWKLYRLGDFLHRQYDSIAIDDFLKYKRITIKTKGQGISLRDIVEGIEIGTKNQFKVKENQFLLSKIDAMNGAFGIVPKECDGGIITGNFWTYVIDEAIVDKEYLRFLCLQQVFTSFSKEASEGTTNRKYLREDKFLNLSLHLPSLEEQKQIVIIIKSIQCKIDEIEVLREAQAKNINNLLFSKYTDIIENSEWLKMSIVAPIHRRKVDIHPEETYYEIGVRSFGKGLFENPSFKGSDLTWQKPFWMKEGDLLFSNIKAWEGAVGLIPKEYDGWVGSHRYITCLPNLEIINPEFLYYYFRTFEGVEKLSSASPGTVDRNRTLNNKLLQLIQVPVPSLEFQKVFVELLKKTNTIKEQYKQMELELTELMSSLLNKAFKGELFSKNTVEVVQDKATISVPVPAKNDDLELAMIIALIESKLGNSYGEVGLQKTVFNIEAFYPSLRRKYNFTNYHFGTYSKELTESIKSNPFLGKKIIKGNEVFKVSPSHKKEVLNAISDPENIHFVLSVNQVLDIYTSPFIGKQTDKIELLNTVTKLIIDLQTTDVNIIHEGMKQWEIKQQGFRTKADKFNIDSTIKTIELLRANGLIEKLIKFN